MLMTMGNTATRLSIKVLPNAGKNAVVGVTGGVWRIKIAAPPEKGKANKELVEFLSDLLGLRKDSITVIKGQTSHNKVIAIEGMNAEEVEGRLSKT
jgi:uncharacterized protein (TIGR00251 family)